MAVFEDEGYFCVDNLPVEMIKSLVELFMHTGSKVARAAVVSDARGGSYFEGLAAMLEGCRPAACGHGSCSWRPTRDAADALQGDAAPPPAVAPGSVAEGIAHERELLDPLRARARW